MKAATRRILFAVFLIVTPVTAQWLFDLIVNHSFQSNSSSVRENLGALPSGLDCGAFFLALWLCSRCGIWTTRHGWIRIVLFITAYFVGDYLNTLLLQELYGSGRVSPYRWSVLVKFRVIPVLVSICWLMPLIFFRGTALTESGQQDTSRNPSIGMLLLWVGIVAFSIQYCAVVRSNATLDARIHDWIAWAVLTISCAFVLVLKKRKLRYVLPGLMAITGVQCLLLNYSLGGVLQFAKYMESSMVGLFFAERLIGWSIVSVGLLWLFFFTASALGVNDVGHRNVVESSPE